jgi:DNA-binding CsgD family transcriptional regulator
MAAEKFAEGMTHTAVAQALGIAPGTVRNHLARVYERLGIHTKTDLVQLLGASADR